MHHMNPINSIDTLAGFIATGLTGQAFLDENLMPRDPRDGTRRH